MCSVATKCLTLVATSSSSTTSVGASESAICSRRTTRVRTTRRSRSYRLFVRSDRRPKSSPPLLGPAGRGSCVEHGILRSKAGTMRFGIAALCNDRCVLQSFLQTKAFPSTPWRSTSWQRERCGSPAQSALTWQLMAQIPPFSSTQLVPAGQSRSLRHVIVHMGQSPPVAHICVQSTLLPHVAPTLLPPGPTSAPVARPELGPPAPPLGMLPPELPPHATT